MRSLDDIPRNPGREDLPRHHPSWISPESTELNLPKFKPGYISVNAKAGNKFQGIRGRYIIRSIGKDHITVEYLDGEWKGRTVVMSKAVHNSIQFRLPITSRVLTDKKLNLWWERYPTIYQEEWQEDITSIDLLGKLEIKYPEQAQSISESIAKGG